MRRRIYNEFFHVFTALIEMLLLKLGWLIDAFSDDQIFYVATIAQLLILIAQPFKLCLMIFFPQVRRAGMNTTI